MSQIYDRCEAVMAKVARRDTERLAALTVKAARFAGVGQRMMYVWLAKSVGSEFAERALKDAAEKTGKDIALPDQN